VAGVIKTQVQALSTQVTYADNTSAGGALQTYLGYQFVVSYSGGNTTNAVVVKGTIAATDTAEPLVLDTETAPPFCKATGSTSAGTTVECALGQLRAGSAPIAFPLFFKAPLKVSGNGVGDAEGTDLVRFAGSTVYAEGSDGAGNTNNENVWIGPVPVTLGTASSQNVKSVLPKAGTLYTGNGGLTSGADAFGTKIVVPAASSHVDATITEFVAEACGSFIEGRCFEMALALQDGNQQAILFNEVATLTLSVDVSVIPSALKIGSVSVFHEGVQVGWCASPTTPNADGSPCIASATQVKKPKAGGPTWGMQWQILLRHNGSFRVL
jgi:hypothetical protein